MHLSRVQASVSVPGVVLAEGGIDTTEIVTARLSEESLSQASALYARKGAMCRDYVLPKPQKSSLPKQTFGWYREEELT